MNVEPRFRAPPAEVFRKGPRRLIDSATLGVSRLAGKLIAVMLAGLTVLLFVTLYQAQLRSARTDAVLQSLLVQADAIAAAVSGAVSADGVALVRTELAGNESVQGAEAADVPAVVTTIQRDAVERRIAAGLEGTRTRARLYGVTGDRLVDSRFALRTGTDVAAAPLPPLEPSGPSAAGRLWGFIAGLVTRPTPAGTNGNGPGEGLPEVSAALGGVKTADERLGADGGLVLSVAVPVTGPEGDVVAALRLTSPPGLIADAALDQELAILRGFLLAAVVAVALSLLLAASITRPIRRLARAAERIKRRGAAMPMPEIRDSGEIGELSRVLHDMTAALHARIDSIEAFAGEVAHELKNPLTSLRSAVETLPLARTDESRARLLDVIQHDVRRIDRLISDISDASKLDAELNRHRYERLDLLRLMRAVVNTQSELAAERGQTVDLVVRGDDAGFTVVGNDSRLGQVFTNLIDNARSFTPDGGTVTVTVQRFASFIEVMVDDEGPGIDEAVMERIFERFYTDRPEQQAFGNNSGLGLAISRQIVEAHNGEIFPENRYRTTLTPERDVAGARFTVRLPVAE
jgi:two-component system sensor histidine kinase ChvG